MPPDHGPLLLALTRDPVAVRALEHVANERGLRLAGELEAGTSPAAIVVDLERAGALDDIARLRRRFPQTLLAAHVLTPRPDLWLEAEAVGCDLVANRGALRRRLNERLVSWTGREQARFALFAAAEVAGRLGCVYRTPDSPVGPLAVYRLEGRLCAAEDACPHAGAVLSEGELEDGVVTCPRHGSRFDVRTGERVRGPADEALRTFALEEAGGYVYLLV